MEIFASQENIAFFEALASDVRLKIIEFLSDRSMNIKEIAENLGLSSAIVTMHINKLEKA
ncbi:ArsR/SmtB family transcription factor [Caldicellulosiruptoraceae bacterium PP1]